MFYVFNRYISLFNESRATFKISCLEIRYNLKIPTIFTNVTYFPVITYKTPDRIIASIPKAFLCVSNLFWKNVRERVEK